jgi:hypothetical protein
MRTNYGTRGTIGIGLNQDTRLEPPNLDPPNLCGQVRQAFGIGAYSDHRITAEFGVYFTTVGRIIRQTAKRADAAR